MQPHATPVPAPASSYRPQTDGAELLAAALHAVVDARPLPAALRPASSAMPRPATVEQGYAWILRTAPAPAGGR